MSIDEILTALQGQKGRAFDQAWKELLQLAEKVDAVRQPQTKKQNEERQRNAVPGQPVTIDCQPAWACVLRYYVDGIRSARNPPELTHRLLKNLRGMAELALRDCE